MFSNSEYENILKAIYKISSLNKSQSKESFKNDILKIISGQLNYHHLLFWEVENQELNCSPILHNIPEYSLDNYLNHFKDYDPLHPINMDNQPTLQLMEHNVNVETSKSHFYKSVFLKEHNFKDEMGMYLKNNDNSYAIIGFLRSTDEPYFNEKDILILHYIKQSIENIYLLNNYASPSPSIIMTNREEELLTYVSKGFTNSEIAQQLYISENTVKKHLQNLYRKFEVSNRTQLVFAAQKRAILQM